MTEGYEDKISHMGDIDESIYWPASGLMQVLKGSRQPWIACFVQHLRNYRHLHFTQHIIQHLQKVVHLHSVQLMVQCNPLHESLALCQKCLCILHVPQKLGHLCFGEGRKPAPTTNICSRLLELHHSLLMWNKHNQSSWQICCSTEKGQSKLQCHMRHISQDVSHWPSKPVTLETAMMLEQQLPNPPFTPPSLPQRPQQGPKAANFKAYDSRTSLANMLRQPAYPLEVKCPCNASTTM